MRQGYYYPIIPDINGKASHFLHSIPIYTLFANRPQEYVHNLGRDDIGALQQSSARHLKDILKKYDKVILSGEDMSIMSKEPLSRMRAFFEQYVDEIVPIVVVRRPYRFLCSVLSEWIKFGLTDWNYPSKIFHTLSLLSVFPETHFLSYEEMRSGSKGLVKSLLGFIGVRTEAIEEVRSNISMSNLLLRLQHLLNLSNPRLLNGVPNPDFLQITDCGEKALRAEVAEIRQQGSRFALTESEFLRVKPVLDNGNDFYRNQFGPEFCDTSVSWSTPIDWENDLRDYPRLKAYMEERIDVSDVDWANLVEFPNFGFPDDFALEGYRYFNKDVVEVFDNDYFLKFHYLTSGHIEGRRYSR